MEWTPILQVFETEHDAEVIAASLDGWVKSQLKSNPNPSTLQLIEAAIGFRKGIQPQGLCMPEGMKVPMPPRNLTRMNVAIGNLIKEVAGSSILFFGVRTRSAHGGGPLLQLNAGNRPEVADISGLSGMDDDARDGEVTTPNRRDQHHNIQLPRSTWAGNAEDRTLADLITELDSQTDLGHPHMNYLLGVPEVTVVPEVFEPDTALKLKCLPDIDTSVRFFQLRDAIHLMPGIWLANPALGSEALTDTCKVTLRDTGKVGHWLDGSTYAIKEVVLASRAEMSRRRNGIADEFGHTLFIGQINRASGGVHLICDLDISTEEFQEQVMPMIRFIFSYGTNVHMGGVCPDPKHGHDDGYFMFKRSKYPRYIILQK